MCLYFLILNILIDTYKTLNFRRQLGIIEKENQCVCVNVKIRPLSCTLQWRTEAAIESFHKQEKDSKARKHFCAELYWWF